MSSYFYSSVPLHTSYKYDECLPFAVDVFYLNYFLTPTPCGVYVYHTYTSEFVQAALMLLWITSSLQLSCAMNFGRSTKRPGWELDHIFQENTEPTLRAVYVTSGRTKESEYLLALCRTFVLFVCLFFVFFELPDTQKYHLRQKYVQMNMYSFIRTCQYTHLFKTRRCNIFYLFFINYFQWSHTINKIILITFSLFKIWT